MIDKNGYRLNVGIIVCNYKLQLLWAKRAKQTSWQFPQGGIQKNETAEDAMYRELEEEIGLESSQVKLLTQTKEWRHYKLPSFSRRYKNSIVGQKQKWFLLELKTKEQNINLNKHTPAEFDDWQWVNYWFPLHDIVDFKKEIYRQTLFEFSNYLFR